MGPVAFISRILSSNNCVHVKPFDFGRPSVYEAFGISVISLVISFFFWSVSILGSLRGYGTPTIVAVCLESFIDCLSTVLVLYRFAAPDALELTPRNHILEGRTSVMCSLTMVSLALILIVFALIELSEGVVDGPYEMTVEVMLSVPSTVLYLVVGMLQLQMAWILQLKSLKQDAIISILGALVSFFTLLSALINLIDRVEEDEASPVPIRPDGGTHGGSPLVAPGRSLVSGPGSTIAGGQHGPSPWRPMWRIGRRRVYRYWWLDEVCTIVVATFMLVLGIWQLLEDTRAGSKWWTRAFWRTPLPSAMATPSIIRRTGHQPARSVADSFTDEVRGVEDLEASPACREQPHESTSLLSPASRNSSHEPLAGTVVAGVESPPAATPGVLSGTPTWG